MRVRIGKALLYGAGLTAGGAGLYSFHKGGYDPDNVGKQKIGSAKKCGSELET